MSAHALYFTPDGLGHALHTERIDLERIGDLHIERASRVEFDNATQRWQVFPGGSTRPVFDHPSRRVCLDWERAWLEHKEEQRHDRRIPPRTGATAPGA